MASGVLVFGEATEDGKLNSVTAELIAAGTRLGGSVTCVLAGSGIEGLAQSCIAAGANKVIVVDAPILAGYQGDAYVQVAERVTKESGASIVLLGQTMIGRDLAPRLAQRLGTAVAMDCVALSTSGDKLIAERPAYGGSARARYSINGSPPNATVRPNTHEPLETE